MKVGDAAEWWMCEGCFEQFDAAVYPEGYCPRPYCDESESATLAEFAGGDRDG